MELVVDSIGIIGAGRLAASLGAALVEADYPLRAVASRNAASARQLADRLGCSSVPINTVVDTCDLVFITVPDAQIGPLAEALAWRPAQAVVHCSGALPLPALEPAVGRGALTGCLHPLQSFPSRTPEPLRFRGIHCGVEAEGPLGSYLETAVVAVGATPFRLEGVDRRLYHAAAVFMSNHVVALASAATRLWEQAGLPEETGREALAPLLLAAANNVASLPLTGALTGPLARGDIATIGGHLAAMESMPDLRELYRALSAELFHLELGRPEETTRRLRELLLPE